MHRIISLTIATFRLDTVITMNAPKRSLQVNVRLSPDALDLMRQAAAQCWPGVPLSNSTLLLTLAQHKAQEILQRKRRTRKKKTADYGSRVTADGKGNGFNHKSGVHQ